MSTGLGGFDPQGDARQALAAALRDHGPAILANPRHLGAVLNILLPTAPEAAEMLVAASRAGASSQLAQQVATMGPDAAVQLVSGSLARNGVLDPRGSLWAVGEIALAMGYPVAERAAAAPAGFPAALGGSPPWTPTGPPARRGGRPSALIAAAVVVVLIAGYLGVAATAKLPPFKGTASPTPIAATTPTPTPVTSASATIQASPSTTPTVSPSASPSSTATPALSQLSNLLPSYITGNTADSCSKEPTGAYVASGESDEELCDLTQSTNVNEDYVLYAGFPTETPASTYFDSVLSSNGMSAGQGDCRNLTLVNTTAGGSQYCAGAYTTSGGNGSDFVFTGTPNFQLGEANPVSSLNVCSNVNSVDVLGFTDPSYAVVGIAISCVGSEEDQAVNADFLAGDFFLGS